jgi:hypothetical protein
MHLQRKPSAGLRLLVAAAIIVGTGFAVLLLPAAEPVRAESGPSPTKVDYQRLAGRWVRPDGGYLLELKEIGKDGSLKAAYFNPRPINIARAELGLKEGRITLVVELRDINYPGSTYTLRYAPQTDRLQGTYFQAVEKQTYEVEFVRTR